MRKIFLVSAVLVLVGITTMAPAKTEEENRLEREAVVLNHTTRQSGGEHAIVHLLKKEFNVDEAVINGLQKRNLGYGDIAVLLSLTQQMPGRIADVNVNKILSLRQGPPAEGWGVISGRLGLNLGAVISQVAGIHREVSEDIRKAQDKEYETGSEGSYERPAAGWWARRGR